MSEGFVKLFDSILDSSVWGEPAPTVKVWITMLLKADKHGRVLSTVPGLVRAAAIDRPDVEAALAILLAPDPDSRTPDNDGRRIEVIEGGWRILNSQKYRELRTEKQVADAKRQKEHRDKVSGRDSSQVSQDVTSESPPYAEADAEAEANADLTTKPTPTPAREDWSAMILECLHIMPEKVRNWEAMLDGMVRGEAGPGGKPVAWETLHEAAVELSTATGAVTAHRYKTFVDKVLQRQRKGAPKSNGKGSTTRAMQIIREVRGHRSPMYPNSVTSGWVEGLSDQEIATCKTFGLTRILNDQNEGTMVAQLTKALEESAHA